MLKAEYLRRLYTEHGTIRGAARASGHTARAITYWLKKHGIPYAKTTAKNYRAISGNGYVLVKWKGPKRAGLTKHGYIYEHRLVVERRLGRRLRAGEIVHHKNGVKTDNRDANLEVTSRSEHSRHHQKTADGIHPKVKRHLDYVHRAVRRGETVTEIAQELGLSRPPIAKLIRLIPKFTCICGREFKKYRAYQVHFRRNH
jgi:hypothetical protein